MTTTTVTDTTTGPLKLQERMFHSQNAEVEMQDWKMQDKTCRGNKMFLHVTTI